MIDWGEACYSKGPIIGEPINMDIELIKDFPGIEDEIN